MRRVGRAPRHGLGGEHARREGLLAHAREGIRLQRVEGITAEGVLGHGPRQPLRAAHGGAVDPREARSVEVRSRRHAARVHDSHAKVHAGRAQVVEEALRHGAQALLVRAHGVRRVHEPQEVRRARPRRVHRGARGLEGPVGVAEAGAVQEVVDAHRRRRRRVGEERLRRHRDEHHAGVRGAVRAQRRGHLDGERRRRREARVRGARREVQRGAHTVSERRRRPRLRHAKHAALQGPSAGHGAMASDEHGHGAGRRDHRVLGERREVDERERRRRRHQRGHAVCWSCEGPAGAVGGIRSARRRPLRSHRERCMRRREREHPRRHEAVARASGVGHVGEHRNVDEDRGVLRHRRNAQPRARAAPRSERRHHERPRDCPCPRHRRDRTVTPAPARRHAGRRAGRRAACRSTPRASRCESLPASP